MLRLPNGSDPLLGRPFALYDTALDAARLRERAAWLGRLQRRKSALDRCAILDDFP